MTLTTSDKYGGIYFAHMVIPLLSIKIIVLLFLLIENAVKYSMPNKYITINFQDHYDNVLVEISSLTPYCDDNDIAHIFEKGYRGEKLNAVQKELPILH